jgi:periplasmic copper chaperone A
MSRLLARLGVVVTAAAALIASGGPVAVAHVTVHSNDAVQGGSAEIAFRVPNENDTASTVNVRLALPADTPIAEVAVLPTAGWTYQVIKAATTTPLSTEDGDDVSEVVSQIEWRATGPDTAVKPGEYQVFRIVAGPLPDTDWLIFKVVQTYDDGQVQRWIDGPLDDGTEPEHPAPLLAVDATSAGHGHSEAATVVPAASSRADTPAAGWWAAVTIALVALIAALGSVVVSIRTARRGGGEG